MVKKESLLDRRKGMLIENKINLAIFGGKDE